MEPAGGKISKITAAWTVPVGEWCVQENKVYINIQGGLTFFQINGLDTSIIDQFKELDIVLEIPCLV